MSFAPLSQASTAEVVADQIRKAIVDGKLAPGDRLIEQDLAAEFATSRGPVREAIRILAAEGIVELRKNRGAIVSSPALDDVFEVYAMRMSLGAIAIAHAIHSQAMTDSALAKLERALERMQDPRVQADASRMVDADLAFQSLLIELGDLPRITEIFEQTATDIRMFVIAFGVLYDDTDHDALIARHSALLRMVRAGSVAEATSAWTEHIRQTIREFMKDIEGEKLEAAFARPLMRHLFEAQSTSTTKVNK
jgi:DNA-binding GntR family transcriptional regulator